MGMFANRTGSSLYGAYDTPPFAPDPEIARVAATPAPVAKPSFFGEGGTGRAIAGTIGDALLSLNHQQPIFAPAMQQRREQNLLLQRQQMQQDAELQRQLALVQYKQAHPDPVEPTALQKDAAYYHSIGRDDLAQQLLENHATAPPLVVDNNNGTKTIYPAGAIPRAGAPTAPVGKLTPVPGGVAPQAPSPFPLRPPLMR